MSASHPSDLVMQITDGHPGSAAASARRQAESRRLNATEQVVLLALLRHARETTLKQRVLGGAGAGSSASRA